MSAQVGPTAGPPAEPPSSAKGRRGRLWWPLGVVVSLGVSMAASAVGQTPALDNGDSAALFDQVWERFDAIYPYFSFKGIDWDAFRERHRPTFEAPLTPTEFARAMAAALAELRDLHVQVVGPDGAFLQVYNPGWERTFTTIPRVRYAAGPYDVIGVGGGWHGWLQGNIAYIRVDTLEDGAFAGVGEAGVDALFARYEGAAGMILDLRPNTGGDEDIALWFARRLADGPRVYGQVQYRDGPGHDDFAEPIVKTLVPGGEHHFTGPVVALISSRNMSSADWFALMLDVCPQVTLVGAQTRGSSGNPEQLALTNGVRVGIPRWFARRADGSPLEDHGVEPDVAIAPEASFDAEHDYVVERALALLTLR